MSEDEIAKARQKERETRIIHAQQRAQAMADLMIGEELDISMTGDRTHVVMGFIGGWIVYKMHKAGIASTFVPFPSAPPGGRKIEQQPGIVVPGGIKK